VILVIVIVLYLSFFSLRGVILPLLVVSLSTVWAVGAMALAGVPMTIMSFIMPVILMAIGIAYCIHVLNKYYEELAAGKERREAVVETAAMMVSPVAMAGMTTVAGFLSLLNSFLIPQRQFGLFTALGVGIAMVLSLVLIPAILSLLPTPKRKMKIRAGILSKGLTVFERVVVGHRRLVLIVSLLIFIAFGIGTTLVRVETSEKEFLGKDHPVVQASEVMDDHFSGSEQVLVEFDTGKRNGLKDPKLLQRIVAFEEWLKTKPGLQIKKTISLADMVCEMNQKFHADDPSYYRVPDDPKLVAQLLLLFTFQGGDLGNMALGDFSAGEVTGLYPTSGSTAQVKLAHEVEDYLRENFPDVHAEMVGQTRIAGSLMTKIVKSQITSLLTSIIAAGLIVIVLMRSLVAGLISLIPLVLTVLINFGVMGFSNTPLDMSTLMVSSIAIGIGIDYAIHFMERFRREYRVDHDERRALETTIQTTGRGIAYNALALALGFAVLLFSSFKGTANFGLLIAMTMVISALSAFTTIPAILVTFKPKFLTVSAWSGKEVGRPTPARALDPDGVKTEKKEGGTK
jgi:predicted RND superfamily exporter protein